MSVRPGDLPLFRWEKIGLVLFGVLIVAFRRHHRDSFRPFSVSSTRISTATRMWAGWFRNGEDIYGAVARTACTTPIPHVSQS